jgi:hypothetical protein
MTGHDLLALGSCGCELALGGQDVTAGWGDLGREARQEGHRVHDDGELAVAPGLLESIDDAAVAGERQPAMSGRRSRDVAAEPLEPGGLARTATDRGVQGVARDVGAELLVRQGGRWRRGRIAEQGGAARRVDRVG